MDASGSNGEDYCERCIKNTRLTKTESAVYSLTIFRSNIF